MEGCKKEVFKLQNKLKGLPIMPRNPRMRKQRDKTMKLLMEKARQCDMVNEISLTAGTMD
jgi:hypothetical protein